MKTEFPNPDDILNFVLSIEPDEGMYKGGSFHFNFSVNQNFPHDPPKVKCTQKIYHPNIDLEGNVCLNILREDWKPVLNLNAVIVGMQVCSFLPLIIVRVRIRADVKSSSSSSPTLPTPSIKKPLTTCARTGTLSRRMYATPWLEGWFAGCNSSE